MLDNLMNLIVRAFTAAVNLGVAAANMLIGNPYLLGFSIIMLVTLNRSFKLGRLASSSYKK